MNITLDTLADINLDMAVKVGFEKAKVDFSERAQAQIANSREAFERMLTSEDAGFVYGSTVAPGARAKKRLNEDNRKSLASTANAWAPKTFGGGNNYVPESAARLVLLGSALNLNIHFHILFLVGVYVYRDNRPPRFQRVKAPNKDELVDLVQLISQRVGRCLQRQGLLEQDTESAWLELQPADDTDAMPHLLGSSVSYRIAVGPQQGRKANVNHVEDFITATLTAGNSDIDKIQTQDSYTTVNANVTYRFGSELQYAASIFGNNLTDEHFCHSRGAQNGNATLRDGVPRGMLSGVFSCQVSRATIRTYGASFSYNF